MQRDLCLQDPVEGFGVGSSCHTHRNNPTFKRSNFVPAVRHILQAASNGKKLEARQVYNDFLNNMKFHYAQMDDMIQAVEQVKSADHLAQAAEKAGFKRVMVQDVELYYCANRATDFKFAQRVGLHTVPLPLAVLGCLQFETNLSSNDRAFIS